MADYAPADHGVTTLVVVSARVVHQSFAELCCGCSDPLSAQCLLILLYHVNARYKTIQRACVVGQGALFFSQSGSVGVMRCFKQIVQILHVRRYSRVQPSSFRLRLIQGYFILMTLMATLPRFLNKKTNLLNFVNLFFYLKNLGSAAMSVIKIKHTTPTTISFNNYIKIIY